MAFKVLVNLRTGGIYSWSYTKDTRYVKSRPDGTIDITRYDYDIRQQIVDAYKIMKSDDYCIPQPLRPHGKVHRNTRKTYLELEDADKNTFNIEAGNYARYISEEGKVELVGDLLLSSNSGFVHVCLRIT